jgi:hypothetical protein
MDFLPSGGETAIAEEKPLIRHAPLLLRMVIVVAELSHAAHRVSSLECFQGLLQKPATSQQLLT